MIYDRSAQCLKEEHEHRQGLVKFLYETAPGRALLWISVRPWISKVYGAYQKSRLSRRTIRPFVEKNGVVVSEEDLQKFRCFNDFFTRKKEITPQSDDPHALLAVADSKMTYYPITEGLKLQLKHCTYDLEDVLEDAQLAETYRGGTCIVFRLCVDDYHRYHFLDDGKLVSVKKIKGQLHTVRPISEKYRVFARNSRQVSILDTVHFGKVTQVEVGAVMVGKICNHKKETFSRMEEKGYFEFGGSTIVLLLPGKVQFDEDIVKMNDTGAEIQVHVGEKIGFIN